MGFNDTDIRWTDKTHNAVHGCSKTSEGCANCYAERVSRRFGHTETDWTIQNAAENVQLKEHFLNDRLGNPAWVFVNSMSDMFHHEVPAEFVHDYYDVCREHPESAFQILTKHGPDADHRSISHPPDNVMVGVSCESPRRRYRIDWLRDQPAATKFVSFEPLVECIPDVDLSGIDWAIIGGESGPNHRPMEPGWARNLVRACRRQDVAVFFKQHSDQQTEARQTLAYPTPESDPQRIEEFPDLPTGVLPKPRKHLEAKPSA